jgi:hypothetical protein
VFVLDTFLHWVLTTVAAAAEAERDDDRTAREQLLEAEMRRELGEISDADYAAIEADVLAHMRAGAARREAEGGGPALVAFTRGPDERFDVEASIEGDFHEVAGGEAPREQDRSSATRSPRGSSPRPSRPGTGARRTRRPPPRTAGRRP